MTNCELVGTLWKHLKTGHIYVVVGRCQLEHSNMPALLYSRPEDRIVWARDEAEFMDGRFENVGI